MMKVAPAFSSSSLVWQLQFCNGHLHGRDDVSLGIAQRTVQVEYDQAFVHIYEFSSDMIEPY